MQTELGIIPHYLFIEQDTGPRHYFSVPLARAYEIYKEACELPVYDCNLLFLMSKLLVSRVSGIARTAHGPTMCPSPGKIQILGITHVPQPGGQNSSMSKVFVLRFLRARNPAWVKEVFFAEFDDKAVWFDDLKPAFGAASFFFEDEHRQLKAREGSSGQHATSVPAAPALVVLDL